MTSLQVEYTNGDLDLGVRFLDFRVRRGKPGEPRTVLVQRAHVVASMSTRAGLVPSPQQTPEPDPASAQPPPAGAAEEQGPLAEPLPAAAAIPPETDPAVQSEPLGPEAAAPASTLVDTQPLGLAARLASAGELSVLGAAHSQAGAGLSHHPALGHALRGVSAPAAPPSANLAGTDQTDKVPESHANFGSCSIQSTVSLDILYHITFRATSVREGNHGRNFGRPQN